jgi:uncharacterized SAM-binding protein YcdF (DUF218 family)
LKKSRFFECRCIRWLLGGLLLFAAACIFAFFRAGHFLDAPAQQPEKADLIVALGGDNGGRSHKAAELYQQGFAPKVLLTGMEGGYAKTRSNYLNWRAYFLIEQGVPENKLMFDDVSASSWDEAINTLRLMQAKDFHRVLVVSDPPHLRRLDWVWSKVFADSGKEYRLVPSDMEGWDAAHWWRNEASAQFVVMEYVKLGYYWVVH